MPKVAITLRRDESPTKPCAATIAILAVLLLPYGFGRLASPRRCVTVHTSTDPTARINETGTIRIACYNIAHGRGLASSNWKGGTSNQRKTRLDAIADLLRSLDADIVVLNEVDFDSSWSFLDRSGSLPGQQR